MAHKMFCSTDAPVSRLAGISGVVEIRTMQNAIDRLTNITVVDGDLIFYGSNVDDAVVSTALATVDHVIGCLHLNATNVTTINNEVLRRVGCTVIVANDNLQSVNLSALLAVDYSTSGAPCRDPAFGGFDQENEGSLGEWNGQLKVYGNDILHTLKASNLKQVAGCVLPSPLPPCPPFTALLAGVI